MPSTIDEQIQLAGSLQEELAQRSRPLSDPRRAEFVEASFDLVEGLVAINGECGLNRADSIAEALRFLESLAETEPALGGLLMARLYPLADGERLHEVCDAIELWMAHLRSHRLAQSLRRLAEESADAGLATRYRTWAGPLELSFAVSRREVEPPSGFELGDLTIAGPQGSATSVGKTPDQGMMIYVTLADLMSGVADLLDGRKGGHYQLVGADSSFVVDFESNHQGRLRVRQGKRILADETSDVVTRALLAEADRFWAVFPLSPDDACCDDLLRARAQLMAVTSK